MTMFNSLPFIEVSFCEDSLLSWSYPWLCCSYISVHKELYGRVTEVWRYQSAKFGRSNPGNVPLVEAFNDHAYNSLFRVIAVIYWTDGSLYNLMEACWSSWMVLEAYKWFWKFMEPFGSHWESLRQDRKVDLKQCGEQTHRQTDRQTHVVIELRYASFTCYYWISL